MKLPFSVSLIALAAAIWTPVQAAEQAGAYSIVAAASAEDCARVCADDGICMAWTFRADDICALSATAPQTVDGVLSGFAARAPAFLRARTAVQQTVVSAPIPDTPVVKEPPTSAAMEEDPALMLLGGPEDDALRPRLASQR